MHFNNIATLFKAQSRRGVTPGGGGGGGGGAGSQEQLLQSKDNGMAWDHLQGSGKK